MQSIKVGRELWDGIKQPGGQVIIEKTTRIFRVQGACHPLNKIRSKK